MKLFNDCALLITSTDRYLTEAKLTISQLRSLGLLQFFDSYLLLGDSTPVIDDVKVLNRKKKGTWSSELRDGLLQLTEQYVFLWLDDFVPLKIHSIDSILEAISFLKTQSGSYIRLNPTPMGNGAFFELGFNEITKGELYRASTILCVWKKDVLLKILDDRETAWQFEFLGSNRSNEFDGFYARSFECIEAVNLVIKGRLDPRALTMLERRGISVLELSRVKLSSVQMVQLKSRELRSRILHAMPWKLRRKIRHLFSTNLKSF